MPTATGPAVSPVVLPEPWDIDGHVTTMSASRSEGGASGMAARASMAELIASVRPGPRRLRELIDRLSASGLLRGAREGGRAIGPAGLATVEIRDVVDDSRRVVPGALFVAVPGLHVDGHDFLSAAASLGAAAAL